MTTELLTTKEAATFLKLKPRTLAKWRCAKVGPPYCYAGKGYIRYRLADLHNWIANRVSSIQVRNSDAEAT